MCVCVFVCVCMVFCFVCGYHQRSDSQCITTQPRFRFILQSEVVAFVLILWFSLICMIRAR